MFKNQKVYTAVSFEQVTEALESGLEPTENNVFGKVTNAFTDIDDAISQGGDIVLSVPVKYLVMKEISPHEELVNRYIFDHPEALTEDGCGAVAKEWSWSESRKRVGAVSTCTIIEPHVLTIEKYVNENIADLPNEGSILNKEYGKSLWKNYGMVRNFGNKSIQTFPVMNESSRIPYSPDVSDLFTEIGKSQRGGAEHAMLRAQHHIGGSPLSFCIEHVGDIYHRMNHDAQYGSTNFGYVEDKVIKTLDKINAPYGFDREYTENTAAQASFTNVDIIEFEKTTIELLAEYAEEHSKLPVYNKGQYLAREASVSLGNMDFKRAEAMLTSLKNICANPIKAIETFSMVTRDLDGVIQEYTPPSKEYSADPEP